MIEYNRFVLENGLRVLVHEDNSTPIAVVNVMYNVGARDEMPNKTGFAHLFEHLMFGGSINIPEYDEPLQRAGGDNNAYTTNDITNYYCTLPAENIETAFWLESDRMLSLAFNEKSLDVQRKVVCEEFKEHYINKPYGDVWHKMRALAYKVHPYKWMTIGKELSHIENATIEEVKAFFTKHYSPINAVLVVAGKVKTEDIKNLAEKWFGSIPSGIKYNRNIPKEPQQTEARFLEIKADVPLDALIKTWHIEARLQKGYYVADIITEILGGGGSSRLYQSLVKEQKIFSNIDCYHFGTIEEGLLTIEGKLVKGIKMEDAENAVNKELQKFIDTPATETELTKAKNKTESVIAFEDMSIMSRAGSLALYELLGDANLINTELSKYNSITLEDVKEYSKKIFNPTNSNTIHYYSNH
ncbi:MAG: insulinase family protein [Bacteroidetes bacterium]|nr:insulinase family protein [Bacteroidota bacterium]MBS1649093.1 insulinase family protein [Bacteroidota bacterium]